LFSAAAVPVLLLGDDRLVAETYLIGIKRG
jgi:hypothetical protein